MSRFTSLALAKKCDDLVGRILNSTHFAKPPEQLGTNSGVAGDLAGSLSKFGRSISLAETFARIDSVTAADVRETATKVSNPMI